MTVASHRQCDDRALLERLVAFDSASHRSNLDIADFICDYVDRPGVRITRNRSPDGQKLNLVIAVGPPAESREGLVLSGHMDVVPPGEGWTCDPFTLTIRGDSYLGRGTCDMKGFLALAINRLAAADIGRLRYPLVLLLTYDEEVGTLGARHLVETRPETGQLPRATIIGEPTSIRVVRMHKGHLRLRLRIAGIPAHSALPHLGRNAVEAAGATVVALSNLRRQLEAERPLHSDQFPEVPFVTLNIARIAGGQAFNVVPADCAVDLGIRLLPEMLASDMIDRVRDVVQRALDGVPYQLEIEGESPPMLLREDAPIHRLLCSYLRQEKPCSAPFTTDAGWLQRLGLDCVLCGPGSISAAHKPDEFLPVEEFTRMGELLSDIVHGVCELEADA